jgi:hypothetical protein
MAIVMLLVEADGGVDDECGCSTAETPLWAAVFTDYRDVVAYLLDASMARTLTYVERWAIPHSM